MNFNIPPTPTPEKEPHWLSLEEIVGKMNNFIDTARYKPLRVENRPDGLVKLIEYQVVSEDGSTSVFTYRLIGPRSANTTIDIAHFRGNPDDGDWLGGGGTLSNYDEETGKWTDIHDTTWLLKQFPKSE
jgi:hypothetical protein